MSRYRPKPGEGMYYVARNRAPLDKYQVGDAVPEAFQWPRTESFVKLGFLQYIPSKPPSPPSKPEPQAKPEEKVEVLEKKEERAEAGPSEPAKDPGLDAAEPSSAVAPSPAELSTSKSGADPKPAKQHGRWRNSPK